MLVCVPMPAHDKHQRHGPCPPMANTIASTSCRIILDANVVPDPTRLISIDNVLCTSRACHPPISVDHTPSPPTHTHTHMPTFLHHSERKFAPLVISIDFHTRLQPHGKKRKMVLDLTPWLANLKQAIPRSQSFWDVIVRYWQCAMFDVSPKKNMRIVYVCEKVAFPTKIMSKCSTQLREKNSYILPFLVT